MYGELWNKVRHLIWSITNNSDGYNGKCMKIKFNLDHELPLNETLKICDRTIIVRVFFIKAINTIWKFFRWMLMMVFIDIIYNLYNNRMSAVSVMMY